MKFTATTIAAIATVLPMANAWTPGGLPVNGVTALAGGLGAALVVLTVPLPAASGEKFTATTIAAIATVLPMANAWIFTTCSGQWDGEKVAAGAVAVDTKNAVGAPGGLPVNGVTALAGGLGARSPVEQEHG
jgi:hypothetical protein